jgi:hypothetical protein
VTWLEAVLTLAVVYLCLRVSMLQAAQDDTTAMVVSQGLNLSQVRQRLNAARHHLHLN